MISFVERILKKSLIKVNGVLPKRNKQLINKQVVIIHYNFKVYFESKR